MEDALSQETREAMTAALAAGGFSSLEAAACEVSLTIALAKLSTYQRECEQFGRKYGVSLEAFRKALEDMKQAEDFTREDDLADWEFADHACQLWQKRVDILRHALA